MISTPTIVEIKTPKQIIGHEHIVDARELNLSSWGISLTTIEIAELTGKRHDNVFRDTKSMLMELYGRGGVLNFEETYRGSNTLSICSWDKA